MSKDYILHCPAYQNERLTFFKKIKNFTINILEEIDSILTEIRIVVILYFIMFIISFIINSTTEYILGTKRFEGPLFDACNKWESNLALKFPMQYWSDFLFKFTSINFLFLKIFYFLLITPSLVINTRPRKLCDIFVTFMFYVKIL